MGRLMRLEWEDFKVIFMRIKSFFFFCGMKCNYSVDGLVLDFIVKVIFLGENMRGNLGFL